MTRLKMYRIDEIKVPAKDFEFTEISAEEEGNYIGNIKNPKTYDICKYNGIEGITFKMKDQNGVYSLFIPAERVHADDIDIDMWG